MMPLVQSDHEASYLDYEARQYGRQGQGMMRDGYQLEPLVLGESVTGLNSEEISYGDMLPTSYKQEVVGMEPSYLADWNGTNWYEEATPRMTQDTYVTMSPSNYELPADYASYNRHTQYNRALEQATNSPVANVGYGSNRGNNYDGNGYQLTSCDSGITRMASVDGNNGHQMNNNGGVESLKHINGVELARKSACASFESSTIQCSSIEGSLQDMSRTESHERLIMRHMNEYSPRNEMTMLGGNMNHVSPVQGSSARASPRGDGKREAGRISMDDLTTFNTHFEDMCKPMKRRLTMPQRIDKDMYDPQKQVVRHFLTSNESSSTVNSTPTSNVGYYDQCLKAGMGSQSTTYTHCDPGYMCDPAYPDNHKNVTSTPTMRSRMLSNGHKGFGSVAAELTTYHSDGYNTGDVDSMKTAILDSNLIYKPHHHQHHNHMDGYSNGRMDLNMLERYQAGLMDPSGGGNGLIPSCCMGMHDTGKINIQIEPYLDQINGELKGMEKTGDEYAHSMLDEVGSYRSGSMGKYSQDDYYHPGVDGLDHFGGIVETFKDEDELGPEIDAETMRQVFEGNRYIEDLGSQYDLARDDTPQEETYVYLRTNSPGEFGGVGLQKERVIAAPTATSSELCEVMLACCRGESSYEPTITWDQNERGYAVAWWSSDENGNITKRQTRVFSATDYGKNVAYEEAVRFAKFAETQIRPSALIRWYPGFNIPIGTSGRTNLRKVLHMDRMKNSELCDPVLAANGMKIATKSTFGDMTIVELYKAAYVLGLWDVAAYNCLKTCKRRCYSYRWIHQMQTMNRRITLDALKYLRNVKESLVANKKSKRNARTTQKRAMH